MVEGSVMSWLANLSSLNLTRQGVQLLWPSLSGLGATLNIACFLVVQCCMGWAEGVCNLVLLGGTPASAVLWWLGPESPFKQWLKRTAQKQPL